MNAVALFPLAGSSGNCADRQDSAVILTASRVRIQATAPLLQRAASAPGGDVPATGVANEWHRQRYLWREFRGYGRWILPGADRTCARLRVAGTRAGLTNPGLG